MKKLFFVAVVIFIAKSAKAQSTSTSAFHVKFSVGGEASLPIGKFNDAGYNFGLGGTLQAEYKALPDFSLILNSGFITYSQKSGRGGRSFSFVPAMGGFKYYFFHSAHAQLAFGAAARTTLGGGTYFIYSPGIGCKLTRRIDALIKFSAITGSLSYNSLGLRLAYNFGQ